MKGSRYSRRHWRDLHHEGRLGFGWWHAGVVAAAFILGWPGVGVSIGLADRSLLITGRAGLPLVTMTFAAGLALRDVDRGT